MRLKTLAILIFTLIFNPYGFQNTNSIFSHYSIEGEVCDKLEKVLIYPENYKKETLFTDNEKKQITKFIKNINKCADSDGYTFDTLLDDKGVWALNYFSDGRDRSIAVFGKRYGDSCIESFVKNEDGRGKGVTNIHLHSGTMNINSVEDIYFNDEAISNNIIESIEYWGADSSKKSALDELDGDISLNQVTDIVKYGLKIITLKHNVAKPQVFKLKNGCYVFTNSAIYYDEYTAEGDYGWLTGLWIVFEKKEDNYYIKFIGNSQ